MLRLLFIGILASIYVAHIQATQATQANKSVNDLIQDKLMQFKTSDSDTLQDLLSILDDDRRVLAFWNIYKTYLKKTYSSPEEDKERMNKFTDNLRKILTANDKYRRGLQSYKLEMNKFGDMDEKEFLATYTGLKMAKNNGNNEVDAKPDLGASQTETPGSSAGKDETEAPGMTMRGIETNGTNKDELNHEDAAFARKKRALILPDHIDYRPLLRPIEDQLSCGSCYAFGVAGTIEGAYAVQRKQQLRLSKQQIVDCAPNSGCKGGWPADQYAYIKKSGGLLLDTVYPYYAVQRVCTAYRAAPGRIRSYGKITSEDENDIKVHLLIYGPLTITIDAHPLQFLASAPKSIVDAPNCDKLNHVVIIVGFGTTNGRDYWLVRNSWGTQWADSGYFKLARNRNGMCGLTKDVHYALV